MSDHPTEPTDRVAALVEQARRRRQARAATRAAFKARRNHGLAARHAAKEARLTRT